MIARLDTRSLGRIKSLLGWVAFARRPLTQVECRSAMAFGQGVIETPMMPPQYIFEMCMPLIQENKDGTFSFIHVSVKDHLKSPESTIGLIEADARCEHGVASITCLLAGFRVFDTAYDSNDRNLRILRGIHGFHIYATEYWLEDLLCSNAAFGGSEIAALLCSTARILADRLNVASHLAGTSTEQELRTLDDRLGNFADQGAVYDMLRYALMERSAKTNSDQAKHESFSASLTRSEPHSLKDLLASYQASIRYLLSISSFPGVTLGELEKFKREFRTAAFTCRVRNCPCATKGFSDEKKLSEHERRHVQRISCTVPGCPYPPLPSSRALKAHMSKCHGITQRIAEVTRISTQKSVKTESRQRAINSTDVAAQKRGYGVGGMAQQQQQQQEQEQQQQALNHALQDYEMQKLLLKIQNRKRLQVAQAEEQQTAESVQSSFDGQHTGEPEHLSATQKMQQQKERLMMARHESPYNTSLNRPSPDGQHTDAPEQIPAALTQTFKQQPPHDELEQQQQFGNHINAANPQMIAQLTAAQQQAMWQQQQQQQHQQQQIATALQNSNFNNMNIPGQGQPTSEQQAQMMQRQRQIIAAQQQQQHPYELSPAQEQQMFQSHFQQVGVNNPSATTVNRQQQQQQQQQQQAQAQAQAQAEAQAQAQAQAQGGVQAPVAQYRPPMYHPGQIKNLPFLSDNEMTKYEQGLRGLWTKMNGSPTNSPDQMAARQKIIEFSRMLIGKIQQRRILAARQQDQQQP
ncbi:uncharacterized protein TrAtP1_009525 [Trichoderma atroviride]|uniref:uncharacterized protein n=1 Tax=Hypocrea atroviridis TaxID=63577 RepID=UPI00332C5420|nr:hypothetical protein TrAtP1_009525 [Trichoderma atroviride]